MSPVESTARRHASRGFTLIELASVLAIVALLLGGLLVPLSAQLEAGRYDAARRHLETAKEALIGYAIANNNRLPCPDNPADGIDGLPDPPAGGPCAVAEGFLPYAVLGLQQLDPWGNRYRYRPSADFVAASGIPNPPDTTGPNTFGVQSRVAPVTNYTAPAPDGPAAVLFSCGKNYVADAENRDGAAPTTPCGSSGTYDAAYTYDVYIDGTFDDVLDWLSKPVLVARLVSAGTWP